MNWKQWMLGVALVSSLSLPSSAQVVEMGPVDMHAPDSVTVFSFDKSLFAESLVGDMVKHDRRLQDLSWDILQLQQPNGNVLETGLVIAAKVPEEQLGNLLRKAYALLQVPGDVKGSPTQLVQQWRALPPSARQTVLLPLLDLSLEPVLTNGAERLSEFAPDDRVELGQWDVKKPSGVIDGPKGTVVWRSARLYAGVDGFKLSEFVTLAIYVDAAGDVYVFLLATSDIERHTMQPLWEGMLASLVK